MRPARRTGWTARTARPRSAQRGLHLTCAALAALGVAACGLSTNGLEAADEGGLPGYDDAAPDTTILDAGGPPDAADSAPSLEDAADSSLPPEDSGADSPPPLDAPADAPAEATPCNGASDCPPPGACQGNHVCGTACGTGQSGCNGGCCSLFTCVAFDNNHCGSACTACGGQTPTCGSNGNCNNSCGGAGDGTCQTSCCNAGTCAGVGAQTCGDFGAACVSCNGSDAGSNCELIALNYVCGCDGPSSQGQCRTGNACHNQQCSPSCDGQHPCNGGCCSGNTIATSTCVASCDAGMNCTGGYCQ